MTKAALQRFDLRVKRMNFSFFNHLGSLSERTANVRKSLDGSRPLTHGERQMEEGMGTAMCRTSNRNKNSDLLKNYQEKMQVWLGKRLSMHSNAAFLCNDDFFKYFPKNSFRMIKDESKEGPKSLEGKDNDQHVFAVGVVKVLRDVPLVIQEAAMPPVKEPAYINPPAVVDFLVKALLDGSDSVKSTVQKIIDGDYFQHLPAEEQAFMKANIGSLYDESNHYLRIEYVSYRMNKLVTEDRNGKRMALNHILKNRFKTFKEFLQSLIQFMLNKEIYRQACLGVLFLILGDYPCWDRMVILLLQGERKRRRTLQHLADLIAASATDEQRVALLEMFDIPEPETHLYVGEPRILSDLYYKLAGKMESCLVPFSGRFHLFALNNSTDHVKFHEPIFTALYAFVKDTDVAKVPKVTSMKARKQICLLDALNGSWLLIRHKYEPIFADMKYASNKALACLRYLLEYAGSLSTVLYNLTFKSGKCNEKVYEHMSMLCFDIFRSQRKNYRQLVIELESQYLYWKKVKHPMLNIVKSSHNIIDEICIEGSANNIIDATLKSGMTSKQGLDACYLRFGRRFDSGPGQFARDFTVEESRGTPVGLSFDHLLLKSAAFLVELITKVLQDPGTMTRLQPNRKTKITTDTVMIPILYGSTKVDLCRVGPPGLAFFPDKNNNVAADRQNSNSSDGYANSIGCSYFSCAQNSGSSLYHMACDHTVCSSCTTTTGICTKCVDRFGSKVLETAESKRLSREKKFISVDQLHLTKVDSDDSEEEQESNGEDPDLDENGDDEPSNEEGDCEEQGYKERFIQHLNSNFDKSMRRFEAEQLVVEQPMAVASMPVQVQLPVDPVVPMAVDIYVSLQPTPELVTGDGVDLHFSAHGSKRKATAGSGTENFAAMHLQKERERAKRNRDLKRKAAALSDNSPREIINLKLDM